MAAADKKITYSAAEVAELIRPLTQSVEALQKENAELKRKLEHMNEVFANSSTVLFFLRAWAFTVKVSSVGSSALWSWQSSASLKKFS